MISGIRSLSSSHEQIVIGWTGDIAPPPSSASASTSSVVTAGADKVPAYAISQVDKAAFQDVLDPEDDRGEKRAKYLPVWLDDKVAHGHYDGYCKQALWPLFHYLLWQDVATEYASADSHYPYYESANAAFARRIAEVDQPGDIVGVHDYHLVLLPRLVRESIPEVDLSLFVHTPFPSCEVFRCLPRRKEILDGMLGADLVCFQTSYSPSFISTCIRVCGYEASPSGIDVEGHVTAVSHCWCGCREGC
ncbi:glycosyltransferase family 20 protein [Laccaria amethystina LaAM-08-1]|uniref:Glycosyltransferase family 20 protein n=1 Tax=Laccaria amethystina LaAM-08-1 TaxID=1095629 RepID=A0A0C9XG12_9AGAR|nr:glycosyltransferase family 20 protein [Laccaria amethystina LaAM-08-1]